MRRLSKVSEGDRKVLAKLVYDIGRRRVAWLFNHWFGDGSQYKFKVGDNVAVLRFVRDMCEDYTPGAIRTALYDMGPLNRPRDWKLRQQAA
jgi:hypothetical protein